MTTAPNPTVAVTGPGIVTLEVGDEQRKFMVHHDLLCVHSQYFRAALQGGFKEAETKAFQFDDVDPEVASWLIHWVYYQRITPNPPSDLPLASRLFRLWVLADRFIMPALQKHVLKELHRKIKMDWDDRSTLTLEWSSADHVEWVWENTPNNSPLRALLLEAFLIIANLEEMKCEENMPLDFMHQLVCRLGKYQTPPEGKSYGQQWEEFPLDRFYETDGHAQDEKKSDP